MTYNEMYALLSKDKREATEQYSSCEIDAYELADLLNLEYDQIGAFIMVNGLRRREEGTLYAIVCPKCGKKWLIPYMTTYHCGECNTEITIDWGATDETV